MKLFKVTDGIEFINVFAESEEHALCIGQVRDYFEDYSEDEFLRDVTAEIIPMSEVVTVNIDGLKISLPAEQWYAIDKGQVVLSASQC